MNNTGTILNINRASKSFNLKKAIENSDEIKGITFQASEGLTSNDTQTIINNLDIIHNKSDLICGIYHFFRPDLGDTGVDEAIFFHNTIKNHIKNSDILICDLSFCYGKDVANDILDFYNKLHLLLPDNKIVIYSSHLYYDLFKLERYPAIQIASWFNNKDNEPDFNFKPNYKNMVTWEYTDHYKYDVLNYNLYASVITNELYFKKEIKC